MNSCRRSFYRLAGVVFLIVVAVLANPIPRAVMADLPDCTWEDGLRFTADEIAVGYGFGMDKLLEYVADHAKSGTSAAGKYASFLSKSNVILAYAKLVISYATLDVKIEMDGHGPLVRRKDRSPGETRQLTATVTQNTGGSQFVNCLRIAANNAGLDFDLPKDGPREDVGVEWDLVSGGTKVATKQDYAITQAIVYLEKGDTTHALTSKTDKKGQAHIMVSGAARKDALPEKVRPLNKEFKVRVNIQLEPPRIRKSIDTGMGVFLGGPAALLNVVPEMLYAARWFSSPTSTFPVTDWEPGEGDVWSGTVTYSRIRDNYSQHFEPPRPWVTRLEWSLASESYQAKIAITGGTYTGANGSGNSARIHSLANISTAAYEGQFSHITDSQPCGRTPAIVNMISMITNDFSGNAEGELTGSFEVKEDGSYEVSFGPPPGIVEVGTHTNFSSSTGWCIPEKNKPPDTSSEAIKRNLRINDSYIVFSGTLDPENPNTLRGTWTKKDRDPRLKTVITWDIQRWPSPGK